ncbi:transporter [Glacieibacterium frigidum]|uniref:Transporter n=1 Tax=Glacieibacterium frigidum TaxID=2593303 RepID=A0A552UH73_9SPHN|nr:transporter [Glacieibacterium frigidum]TRW17537.1 transporter [Glacieibacterium frigidum]
MAPNPRPVIALLGAALIGAAPLFAAEPARRDFTTDRPDTTESPFTVEPGHFQVETTLFGYALGKREDGARPRSYEFATTNVRFGVTSALEIDVGIAPYGIFDPGTGPRRQGVGAIELRPKLNLWGDDGGPTALALLPFVSIPLDPGSGVGPDDVEYGVLVPLALDFGGGLGLGLNGGVVARRPDADRGYRAFGIATASLSVDWSDTVGSYFEAAAEIGDGQASTSLNTGITWQARDDLQFDTGVQVGVSGDADRFAPFVGVSLRF